MKEKNKGLAAGAAIGAVLGVITGILFAPKSGKETRKDLKDAAEKAGERFSVEAKKLEEEITALLDKADDMIKSTSTTVSSKLSELEVQAKDAQAKLVTLYKSVRAGKAEDAELDEALQKAKESRDALKSYLKKNS